MVQIGTTSKMSFDSSHTNGGALGSLQSCIGMDDVFVKCFAECLFVILMDLQMTRTVCLHDVVANLH